MWQAPCSLVYRTDCLNASSPVQSAMASDPQFFATCPRGLEGLLADELRALQATEVRETRAGVSFAGPLAIAYRACLWSRTASRVLLPLARFPAATPEALYAGVQTVDWDAQLAPDGTLAVDASLAQSALTHSHFVALKVKDAIVDQFRERHGVRPSVNTERPDVRVNVHVQRDMATISIDLSGDSLHRRGYRIDTVAAPLKETLAAAILLRAQWPALAGAGGALVDVMCGSGTLLIEGALMAGDVAPGLLRTYFGFLAWGGHDAETWSALRHEAEARRDAGLARLPVIEGYDVDQRAVRAARANIKEAGLADYIRVQRQGLGDCAPRPEERRGLVVANAPYGERLGEAETLKALYKDLGAALARCYAGWEAAVFTGNVDLGRYLQLRAHRVHTLYNGALECRLLRIALTPEAAMPVREREDRIEALRAGPRSEGATMFANRLQKDLRHYGRWAKNAGIDAYRLYDADMPEYNLAIDVYESDRRYVHVQEYEAPATIDVRKAQLRLNEALAVIPEILEIPPGQMHYKVRRRQKGGEQYERLGQTGEFHTVHEGKARFLVNFTDYLDTGLFLDHRITRTLVADLAQGRRFLNLFGYTGAATVHAALGGAIATTTVDLSNTYLDWTRRNLELNGLDARRHERVQADVFAWLAESHPHRYGLIFLDPPTFSRSKRMAGTLDIQRDHVTLIRDAAALLEANGILVFSTNLRTFRLDRESLADFTIDDITRRTIPKDFERNPKIHHCFRIARQR